MTRFINWILRGFKPEQSQEERIREFLESLPAERVSEIAESFGRLGFVGRLVGD